ncbi:4'-phosphopantetheinyl transferase superfamily protein, partial [Flavobacteriaceae bacterium]|nr:4'-phosphopantetheinyl transferase superfamily protein [Flavobacteriaceae bacterium]
MKNKIKEIHNKLSSSKIDSFESIINTSSFSSVLKDRFVSELKKMKINWDLNPTTINKLVNNKTTNSASNKSEIIISEIKSNKNLGLGIDIQLISSLPVVNDPWEDQFYIDNFKKNEIAHCLKKKNIFQSFAGIFALKEAIYKIDGTEKNDITIKFSKDGKPL